MCATICTELNTPHQSRVVFNAMLAFVQDDIGGTLFIVCLLQQTFSFSHADSFRDACQQRYIRLRISGKGPHENLSCLGMTLIASQFFFTFKVPLR